MFRKAAIIVAAGKGERAGAGLPKQYRILGGRPALRWSIETLAAKVDRLVAVVDPAHQDLFGGAAGGLSVEIAPGGATRTESVRAGLAALKRADEPDVVLIHDGARPGLSEAMVERLLAALDTADGAAPALPVADALKRIDERGQVIADEPRAGLMRVQTPQAFRFAAIVSAYEALPPGEALEDDIAVARRAGLSVELIPGDLTLMKLTHVEDFAVLERLLWGSFTTCVGTGFDAHRFGPGDHVMLCGVSIAHERGLVGHSDADAGWHALTDALLGAVGAGDIGVHFPPSDPQWRGVSSEVFLRRAVELVHEAGGRIAHVDVTLICEAPKLAPYREAMRIITAEILGLPLGRVSVKATTTERMGFTGREEGLAAQAVAAVEVPRRSE